MYLSAATQRDNAARVRKIKAAARRCPRVATNWEQAAIAYARWLAARDGIALPTSRPRVEWSGVNTLRGSKWIFERRIRAVSWGREESVFNKRKDGRRGAWSHNAFVADVTVPIPNWDWAPQVFDETPALVPVSHAAVAVSIERASYGGTIQLSQPVMVF
jgi:hypothetical protein